MAAWFYEVIKFIFLLLGFTKKLFGNDGGNSSVGTTSEQHVTSTARDNMPASHLNSFDGQQPTNNFPTPLQITENLPSSNNFTTSGNNVPTANQYLNKKLPANTKNPAALRSDPNNDELTSKVGKATDVGPLLRFAKAVQELNLTKIGNYDERTQQLIRENFELSNEDKYLNTSQLIEKCGHPVEEFTVRTPDEYMLKLVRIPGAGPPVLIMHGLMACSDDFLTSGCEKSLPYVVSSAGYDVWLGNARGNKYSKRHQTLTPDTKEFWDFSWHEIGVIDLSIMIDFILIYTGQSKLLYIGHSQGTTSLFVLLSERPEYNEKVSLLVALAPVAWLGNSFSPLLQVLSQFVDEADFLQQAIGEGEFALGTEYAELLRAAICATSATAALVCDPAVSATFGFTPAQKNFSNLPVQYTHIFTSCSTKQVIHYLQEVRSGKFQQFDYGEEQNKVMYGTPTPREYDVSRITAAAALVYGGSDWLVGRDDVQRLVSLLPNVVLSYLVPEEYSHMDYIWAFNADELVNSVILKLFDKHKSPQTYH